MKATTTTLGNLIEQVETMSTGNFDETVSLNEIEFSSLNEMWIGGVGVEVLPQAQRLFANRLGCAVHRTWSAARPTSRRRI